LSSRIDCATLTAAARQIKALGRERGAVRLGVEAAVVEGRLVRGDVAVEDGRIAAVGLSGEGRGTAVPGFVDLQVNGFAGVDFLDADADALGAAADALLRTGVTAFQPTLITSPTEETTSALHSIAEASRRGRGASIVGAHLEGPFLAPERAGAHPAAALRLPDGALVESLLASGPVSTVTLAPELPGALGLVETLVRRGVCVSLGHSNATAGEARAAFARGARTVTHLFNAMRPLTHRDPGIAGAALADPGVDLQLIVDGHHLADETVLLAWRAGRGRLAVVSDAIAAAGLGDGTYRLGGVEVHVKDGVSRRADGKLAGSLGTMAQAVRRLCALGVPLSEAVDAATRVPARILGRPELGTLAPGSAADVAVLDDALEVVRVLRRAAEPG
jgi:N-acetylglucosamine-6-phosphate deacetylase